MKTRIILASLFLGFFVFISGLSYSQNDQTLNSKCSCSECKCPDCNGTCTDGKCSGGECKMECKGNHSCKDKMGNAGGDSTVSGLTCPVSNESIGEGQGVKFDYAGKTYTFCCEGCVGKFKKEPMNYIKEEVNCPVMGEPAAKDVYVMHNDTKYYFCCKMCIAKFEKDPEKYLKKN